MQAAYEGAVQALGQGAQIVSARAKARAPIRNIFGVQYSFRTKSIGEINAAREALGGEVGSRTTWRHEEYVPIKTASGMRSSLQRDWRQRRTTTANAHLADYKAEMASRKIGEPPQDTKLSKRGAYEVKSKRASYSTWKHLHTGGRLRGEIYATDPNASGSSAEAWVIAPTEYAKYQEFGSRHNRAHPFLRPAAEESRGEVTALVAEAVRGALPHGGTNVEIEIMVRL